MPTNQEVVSNQAGLDDHIRRAALILNNLQAPRNEAWFGEGHHDALNTVSVQHLFGRIKNALLAASMMSATYQQVEEALDKLELTAATVKLLPGMELQSPSHDSTPAPFLQGDMVQDKLPSADGELVMAPQSPRP
ncbi:hypothetical protein E2562_018379 [Oryza meyeriana var. granulata]|uniref:Uncharacterized protein n=1 Tax=Oryza meyeriana var. granulata TaxID=110450 RepID=A0A6G1D5H9_9ORYZ|nr:hypothetical protein E2562_018379 [Oryza meyeriana var. granulata]